MKPPHSAHRPSWPQGHANHKLDLEAVIEKRPLSTASVAWMYSEPLHYRVDSCNVVHTIEQRHYSKDDVIIQLPIVLWTTLMPMNECNETNYYNNGL